DVDDGTDYSTGTHPTKPAKPAGPVAMNDVAFATFLGAVQGNAFDNAKADMVRNASRKNWFTAAQLGQLLDAFVMENSKLDAAKAAVPKLVDPANAYGLAQKFTFSTNQAAFTALLAQ